ncbi:uncharacterized protein C8A04DRAFT_33271 [Dichotomopilus funicola]|uniref:Uncharacterized protein n=1 Tax=Dichotomopilus funicola TaxID=1934379 RepID=A0AAN6UU66_9PEZI|nr:hypothetical protein C8A04DRAFT_33271 [Dichotomopilus funicola]
MAGEDVADFLMGAVGGLITAGESVIKVAAPEIEKAITAAGDALAENGLDLAKVLDLSGAFIPSSPLAFAEALKLARSLLAAVPELDGDTSVLKTIERLDKEVAPFTTQSEDVLQQVDVIFKTAEQLELETQTRVRNAAIDAYKALQEAVDTILEIKRGNARLQRVDPTAIPKVDRAIEAFDNLSKVSSNNAWKLGKDNSALMSFGDNTKTFRGTLDEESAKLKTQLQTNEDTRTRHKAHLKKLQEQESDYLSRKRRANRELDDVLNNIGYVFAPSGRENQRAIIRSADESLKTNRTTQRGVINKIRGLHLLDTLIRWASRALDVVIESVARIAQDFQAKFRRITDAQQTHDRLFAGLLSIANAVQDANIKTSRDNALRVVLGVLKKYHDLRVDHSSLDIPGIEDRPIQTNIVKKLGESTVRQLLLPPVPPEDDGDDAINNM